jgi:hypothetical protein
MTAPRYQDIKAAEIPEIIDTTGPVSGLSAATSGVGAVRSKEWWPTRGISTSLSRRPAQNAAGRDGVARLRLCVRGLRNV